LHGVNLREDILIPAKISAGSFYHQFSDKTELLLAILDLDMGEKRKAGVIIGQANSIDLSETMGRLARSYFDMADKNPYILKIYVQEYYSADKKVLRNIRSADSAASAALARLLEGHKQAGANITDANIASRIIGSLIISVTNYYVGLPAKERAVMREKLLTELIGLILNGISPRT
jgi:AcrR family transcriptional regulator